ncbi:hypothetical protein [Croceibacter atlanticus]|uniref:hypothetical protein n=1 Tax=Croceibacter atlanticus TaxID=313588 RepID=UPI0032B1877F
MKYLTILLLLISTYSFSQKHYNFDYLLEYDVTYYKYSEKGGITDTLQNEKTLKKYYLTNSKFNNYKAEITELDTLTYQLIFTDNLGVSLNVTALKKDLDNAEFINVDCKYVKKLSNRFNYQTKHYDFINLNDTLLKDMSYKRYKLTSIKPKRTKRHKLATLFYIIEDSTAFHLPLLIHTTAYNEFNKEHSIPNGIFKERYLVDYDGNLDFRERLISIQKIDKKLVIGDECNYSANK